MTAGQLASALLTPDAEITEQTLADVPVVILVVNRDGDSLGYPTAVVSPRPYEQVSE